MSLIPVLDIAPFLAGSTTDKMLLAKRLDEVCSDVGFLLSFVGFVGFWAGSPGAGRGLGLGPTGVGVDLLVLLVPPSHLLVFC